MEPDIIHQRVLELQKNIEEADANQQKAMLQELLDIMSHLEQSLTDVKKEINNIENEK